MKDLRDTPTSTGTRHARHQRRQRAQQRQAVLGALAEADARVGPDLANPGGARGGDARIELAPDLGDHVIEGDLVHHRGRLAAQVPEHDRGARIGGDPEDRRIQQPSRDIIDDGRPGGQRGARRTRLVGVDRQARAIADAGAQPGEHRYHTRDLFGLRNHQRARPRRLASYVEPVGAVVDHPHTRGDRVVRGGVLPAVGEGVRGGVEDTDEEARHGVSLPGEINAKNAKNAKSGP